MELLVIGDEIVVDAFRLAGVEGLVAATPEEALNLLDERLNDETVALIAQSLAAPIRDEIERLQRRRRNAVCLLIPDLEGEPLQAEDTQRLIEQAIGIKL